MSDDVGPTGSSVEPSPSPQPSPNSVPVPDASAPRAAEPTGLAWAITTRLNRFTRTFLGPAQVGERAARTEVVSQLPPTPCSSCGKPLADHELVRTTEAKMRLYCPTG
jgi:hypothetical protein